MKKTLKITILSLASLFVVSCGKNAPDPTSSEVEELTEQVCIDSFWNGKQPKGQVTVELVDLAIDKVDNEIQKVEYSFRYTLTYAGHSTTTRTRTQATARYTSDDDLLVEVHW